MKQVLRFPLAKSINDGIIRVRPMITRNGLFYAFGLAMIFGLKYYYSKAGSDDLGWILAPTAWWVEILSGIPFEREAHLGFVNHAYRFIIAPSCSGVNFLIISFSMLLFSFIHRMRTLGSKLSWTVASLGLSYLFTVLVNGFRIVVSIYLAGLNIYGGWITSERIHMIEGASVYFVSLIVLYISARTLVKRFEPQTCRDSNTKHPLKPWTQVSGKFAPPLFWYFSITLGIPLANRAYVDDAMKFTEHAILIVAICTSIVVLFRLALVVKKSDG